MCITQRYLMYISYLGSGFSGSQIQRNAVSRNNIVTVQGSLEEGLQKIFPEVKAPIKVTCSSRTDSGVHAIRTGVHFDLPKYEVNSITPEYIRQKLTSYLLSKDLRILNVVPVPSAFHARTSAVEKVYLYRLGIPKNDCIGVGMEPISEIKRTFFFKCHDFDINKVRDALKLFIGQKDFASYCVRLSNNKRSTICRINSFTLEPSHPLMLDLDLQTKNYEFYQLKCAGNRFLYKMVRRMVGILLAVGSNKLTLKDIEKSFIQPGRFNRNFLTVPGNGLYLLNVTFNSKHMELTENEVENKEDATEKKPQVNLQEGP